MKRKNQIIKIFLEVVTYILVLLLATKIFPKTIKISSHQIKGLWLLWTSGVVLILNRILKPILKHITLPILAFSFGLLYPLINVAILYITSLIFGDHFILGKFKMVVVLAVFLSITTLSMSKALNKIMKGMVEK